MPQLQTATTTEHVANPPGSRRRFAMSARARALCAAGSVLIGCALWFCVFGKIGVSTEALPWYFSLAAIGVICALQAARQEEAVSLPLLIPPSVQRQPVSLLESWAVTYFAAALLLYVLVGLKAMAPAESSRRLVQFVDIKLVSAADFANRNSPLPGTQEMQELHKRQGDRVTRQGELQAKRPAQAAKASKTAPQARAQTEGSKDSTRASRPHRAQTPSKSVPVIAHTRQGIAIPAQPSDADAQDIILVKPAPLSAQSKMGGQRQARGRQSGQQPLIEEVQPPELVEVIDNDGMKQSPNVFLAGGSSQGGTGASNELSVYLKELHKRIKTFWSPPRGQSHRAAVLFRVRKDGRLAFIKLVASSGDCDTDSAALAAIAGAVKGLVLPTSSNLPFLDVQYTFNYTADELKEVGQPMPPDDDLL